MKERRQNRNKSGKFSRKKRHLQLPDLQPCDTDSASTGSSSDTELELVIELDPALPHDDQDDESEEHTSQSQTQCYHFKNTRQIVELDVLAEYLDRRGCTSKFCLFCVCLLHS